MRRKKHARFLGGWTRATASGYPTSAIKIVNYDKRKWLFTLEPNGNGGGSGVFDLRPRDPCTSRSIAGT